MGEFNTPFEKPLSDDHRKLSSGINSSHKELINHANSKILKPVNLENSVNFPDKVVKLSNEMLKPENKLVYPNQGDNQINLIQPVFILGMDPSPFIMFS